MPWPRRARSAQEVSFGDNDLKVQDLDKFDFKGVDIALFSPGGKVSAVHAPRARQGRLPSSSTTPRISAWTRTCRWSCRRSIPRRSRAKEARHHRQPELLDHPDGGGAEAAARSSRASSASSSRPISRCRARASEAMDELFNQTRGIYVNDPLKREQIPQADRLQRHPADRHLHGRRLDQGRMEDGGRDQKILDGDIAVQRPACACRCSSAMPKRSMSSSRGRSPSPPRAKRCKKRRGVVVVDHRVDEGYVTPVEARARIAVYVSRIRQDPTVTNGLNSGGRRQSA